MLLSLRPRHHRARGLGTGPIPLRPGQRGRDGTELGKNEGGEQAWLRLGFARVRYKAVGRPKRGGLKEIWEVNCPARHWLCGKEGGTAVRLRVDTAERAYSTGVVVRNATRDITGFGLEFVLGIAGKLLVAAAPEHPRRNTPPAAESCCQSPLA